MTSETSRTSGRKLRSKLIYRIPLLRSSHLIQPLALAGNQAQLVMRLVARPVLLTDQRPNSNSEQGSCSGEERDMGNKGTCLQERQIQHWSWVMLAKQTKWKCHQLNTWMQGFYRDGVQVDIRDSEIESRFGLRRGRIKEYNHGECSKLRFGRGIRINYNIKQKQWRIMIFLI